MVWGQNLKFKEHLWWLAPILWYLSHWEKRSLSLPFNLAKSMIGPTNRLCQKCQHATPKVMPLSAWDSLERLILQKPANTLWEAQGREEALGIQSQLTLAFDSPAQASHVNKAASRWWLPPDVRSSQWRPQTFWSKDKHPCCACLNSSPRIHGHLWLLFYATKFEMVYCIWWLEQHFY